MPADIAAVQAMARALVGVVSMREVLSSRDAGAPSAPEESRTFASQTFKSLETSADGGSSAT